MSPTQRNATLFVGLSVAAFFGASYASSYWFKALISDRTFTMSLGLIHWPMLLSWIPAIIIFAVTGFALAIFLQNTKVMYWAFALGALYSLIQLFMTSYWFSSDAGWFEYFWAFAGHAVPPLSSVAGAAFVQHQAAQRRYP